MEEKKEKKEKKKRGKRSPGYPLINLEEAIQRAKILWDKDKNNLIPKDAVFEHLGYQFKGGYGARVIAALKHFGLTSEKKGHIILTSDAIDLAVLPPTDENYNTIVRKLALIPDVYSKIYNEYKDQIPSDATLKLKLIRDYGFNAEKVDDFIVDFRKTLYFAGLTDGFGIEVKDDINITDGESTVMRRRGGSKIQTIESTISKGAKSYPIPLSEGENAAIMFSRLPVKKKDIESIVKWLEIYSDNLTESDE